MVDKLFRQTSKQTWYKWSLYINIFLFLVVGAFLYLLVKDCIDYGRYGYGDSWLFVTRDIAFIGIALALIFFQFIRNLFIIMRRSL
jgi:hypothetical protein